MHTRTANQILVKVIDFGIAVEHSDHPDIPLGHPAYLAPECFIQKPELWGNKIDVWALAMVALKLLSTNWPFAPPASLDYSHKSLCAEGWGGRLQDNFKKTRKAYLDKDPKASACFFKVLSCMFDSKPKTRIAASEACKELRKGYKSDYFLSLGSLGDIPVIVNPVIPKGSQSDDDSIFRFRKMDVEGFKSLNMWAGCYLVRMNYVMKAKYGKKAVPEVETFKVQSEFKHACWRFKRTDSLPEWYITIAVALHICKGEDKTRALAAVLREQQARQKEGLVAGLMPKVTKDKKPAKPKKEPAIAQLSLVESISPSDSIIAITEENRMLLVRAFDGYIHLKSLHAASAKRLLLPDDVLDGEYVPLEQAMLCPGVLTHNDIVSLGAATYSSY